MIASSVVCGYCGALAARIRAAVVPSLGSPAKRDAKTRSARPETPVHLFEIAEILGAEIANTIDQSSCGEERGSADGVHLLHLRSGGKRGASMET
jgi:hypothetical protein